MGICLVGKGQMVYQFLLAGVSLTLSFFFFLLFYFSFYVIFFRQR
jgi:hypothetical protein